MDKCVVHFHIVSCPEVEFQLPPFLVIQAGTLPAYTGDYVVDPDFEGVTLATRNRVLTDDITVNPIEISRTSNTSGGQTVYIGGIISG